MRRVVILGCSGSGKSTLARTMGERLGLPVVHLDALFWSPGWVEPDDNDAFRARVAQAIAGDAWITDGNYVGRTFDLRLPRADLVIYVDQPRRVCLWRVLKRFLTDRRKRRADLAEGCYENLDWDFTLWVWNFERKSRPRIEATAAAFGRPMRTLRGDREIAAFLRELSDGVTPTPSA
jgi:adenylate kinase family enzyme